MAAQEMDNITIALDFLTGKSTKPPNPRPLRLENIGTSGTEIDTKFCFCCCCSSVVVSCSIILVEIEEFVV